MQVQSDMYDFYKEILYESGLDDRIEILGTTDILERDRESEVIDYLEKHQNTNKFIILDVSISIYSLFASAFIS